MIDYNFFAHRFKQVLDEEIKSILGHIYNNVGNKQVSDEEYRNEVKITKEAEIICNRLLGKIKNEINEEERK